MISEFEKGVYFTVKDCFGRKIHTTKNYWRKIVNVKHPIVFEKEDEVKKTLNIPDFVKRSSQDLKVYLYYKKKGKYYLCVVARHEDGSGFIITAYIARSIAKGEVVWEK